MLRFLLSRYDRWSLVALACHGGPVGDASRSVWKERGPSNLHVINWFLIAIWVFMTALLCWDVRPAQDIALAVVALAGGALFEGWGTNTGLLVVLHRGEAAALGPARVAGCSPGHGADRLCLRPGSHPMERQCPGRSCTGSSLSVFVVVMARFVWPSIR